MYHTADCTVNHLGVVNIIDVVVLNEVHGTEQPHKVGSTPDIQFQKETNAGNGND